MFGLKTKIIALISILFFLFSAVPLTIAATEDVTLGGSSSPEACSCQEIIKGGPLVCCGNEGCPPCTFYDIFITINRVVDFILYVVIPPLAVIALIMASISLLTSEDDPSKLEQAKKTLVWIVIGLIVIYSAWFLVVSFVKFIGGADWTLNFFNQFRQ